MGKPYLQELRQLAETYSVANNLDTGIIEEAIASASSHPVFIIGSGGSLTAAQYICSLHQRYTGCVAKALTPLEFIASKGLIRGTESIWIISAGGRNPDIRLALKIAIGAEPKSILVVTSVTDSPISKQAAKYEFIDQVQFELPVRRQSNVDHLIKTGKRHFC